MNNAIRTILIGSMLCGLITIVLIRPVLAEDMRAENVERQRQLDALLHQAAEEARQAAQEAAQTRQKISTDRAALEKAVAALEARNRQLEKSVADAENQLDSLQEKGEQLQFEFAEAGGVVKEIVGFVRGYASDLNTLFVQSPQSAWDKDRGAILQELAEADRFPSMDDIDQMVDRLLVEIDVSGQVRRTQGMVITEDGDDVSAEILLLGNFTVAFRTEKETGYALYSESSRRFFALSRQPSWRVIRQLNRYMDGATEAVYVDISKGGALRQLTHRVSLLGQIPHGGPIIWPIFLVLVLGGGIIIERSWYLRKKTCDPEDFMGRVNACVIKDDWDACRNLCEQDNTKAVPRVIQTALEFKNKSREDMENALQETILNEIPRLERFLSTLGMLAAIAPLMGLLGTVTGMINTFHMITYYGTGDARMMSGGISEALVTTMLGLCVAIPLMFAHTLLSRKVETIISQMEEKAVSFVNQVFKSRSHI